MVQEIEEEKKESVQNNEQAARPDFEREKDGKAAQVKRMLEMIASVDHHIGFSQCTESSLDFLFKN